MPTVQAFLRSLSSLSDPPCWIACGTFCAPTGAILGLIPKNTRAKRRVDAATPAEPRILRIGPPPTLALYTSTFDRLPRAFCRSLFIYLPRRPQPCGGQLWQG